jgi:non-ribosomal peptide synthetase-like protein
LIRPGYHADEGATAWALWCTEGLMRGARGALFALFASLFTRRWLCLAGIRIGKRSELSTVIGLNRLTSFSEASFAADEVTLLCARARDGWLHVAPIEVGARTFLGNGALLRGDTKIGNACTIGVLTAAPMETPDGTSWLGDPALELPRVPDRVDKLRTTHPPRRLVLARGGMDIIRIVLPPTVSIALAGFVFWALEAIGTHWSTPAMVLAAPVLLLAAGVIASALTVAAKWLLMGRYRVGEHPLWSFFVWRDEVLNSLQEQLAGAWLLAAALGTPVVSTYLRAMGATIGRDVWCETLAVTEYDLVELADGSVANRLSCIQTHLFHDRLLRIGPARLGPRSTLGVASCVLPETVLGSDAKVGARSVVLRGEELPAGTSWHGAPVVSA